MSAATSTIIAIGTIAATGAVAAGSAYSANKTSNAAEHGADVQTTAANHAADLQSKAAADALAFQKQAAENDFKNQELTRQANYNQWAAREQRLSSFGQMLGLGPRDIPAYVASQDPAYGGQSATIGGAAGQPPIAPGATPAGSPASSPTNADPQAAFMSAVNALGIQPADARNNLSKITDYLNAHGMPGWAAADGKAGDYVSYQGQGFDVLPAGDKNWQWLNDNGASGSAPAATSIIRPMGTAAAYAPNNIAPALQAPTFAGMLR